jgi:hypothetical protein
VEPERAGGVTIRFKGGRRFSSEPWPVYHLPPLVPIWLVRPQMEGKQRGGVAARGGAGCKGHEGVGK